MPDLHLEHSFAWLFLGDVFILGISDGRSVWSPRVHGLVGHLRGDHGEVLSRECPLWELGEKLDV